MAKKKKKKVSSRAARASVEEHEADVDGVDDDDGVDDAAEVEEAASAAPVEAAPVRPAISGAGAPVQYQKGSGWFGIVLIALFVLGIVASMMLD